MIQNLNKLLKWLLVLGLIILAILSVYYKYDNCSKCKFEMNRTIVNAKEFMIIYSDKCFDYNQNLDEPYFQDNIEALNKLTIEKDSG